VKDPLKRIVEARQDQMRARDRLVQEIEDAVQQGVSQTAIAEALGLNRLTIWRWLNDKRAREEQEDDPSVEMPFIA
jgi:DNA invertase Pin-like site-specific DNA recombinase